jgi:thiamine pyrophosphokinase
MSSHHIVRDNQESALIIANGESCSMLLLDELMEWCPYVLVLDGAMRRVQEMGLRADAWLGDFDSHLLEQNSKLLEGGDSSLVALDWEQQLLATGTEKILAPDQVKTDLEKGIEFLISRGHTSANVIWGTGRRMDHTFQNLSILPKYQAEISVSILDDYSRVYPLPKHFRKWYPAGTNLSLMPIGKVEEVYSENLDYPLQGMDLELPYRSGSSNRVTADGFVEIRYNQGHLLLMECWDRK